MYIFKSIILNATSAFMHHSIIMYIMKKRYILHLLMIYKRLLNEHLMTANII